jgi:hypothetical protein
MRRVPILALVPLVVLGLAAPARAQVAVEEVGPNLFQNTITAIEAVAQTLNQVLELTALEGIIVDGTLQADLGQIGELIMDAEGLMHDVSSLQAQLATLFDTNTLPTTPATITQRYYEMRAAVRQARWYAVRTQTLINTTVSACDHLMGLVSGIASLLGNQQANQTALQIQSTIAKLQASTNVQAAAFQRADMLERMGDDIVRASLIEMRLGWMDGWPGVAGGGQ